ncbi:MAG: hypothetical protein ACRCV0_05895 [Brevinema sp.]
MKYAIYVFLFSILAVGNGFSQQLNSNIRWDIVSGSSFVNDAKMNVHFNNNKIRAMYTNEKGIQQNLIFDQYKTISPKVALFKKGKQFIGAMSVDSNTIKVTPVQMSEEAALDEKNMTLIYTKSNKKLIYTPTTAKEQ